MIDRRTGEVCDNFTAVGVIDGRTTLGSHITWNALVVIKKLAVDTMRLIHLASCILALTWFSERGLAASNLRPPPVGAPSSAPREYTSFDELELTIGFMRL